MEQPGADGEVPAGLGLTAAEYEQLRSTVEAHHRYAVGAGQCSSLLAQRIHALPSAVWGLWHKLPPLQMKPAGASCSGSTWDPNNGCPPTTKP